MYIKRSKSIKSIVTMLIAGSTVLLAGCSSMFSNEARCPFADQGGCQSVEDVNKMISERKFTANGDFVQQAYAANSANSVNHGSASSGNDGTNSNNKATDGNWSGWNSPTPFSGQPLRTQEIDARMWVAPWQDQDNSYHGSSYITFVVQAAQWSNLPAKAITNDDYDDAE